MNYLYSHAGRGARRPHLPGALIAALAGAAPAGAACVPPDIAAAPERVARFSADPAAGLARFPDGHRGLAAEIRDLVASDPRALGAVGAAAGPATAAERRAIGAGLGQAAIVCRRSDPDATRRIQELIVGLDMPELTAGYSAATGETRTASVGGEAGPDGGGGGTGPGRAGAGGRPGAAPAPPTGTASVANAPGGSPAGYPEGDGAAAPGTVISARGPSFAAGLNAVSPTSPAQ